MYPRIFADTQLCLFFKIYHVLIRILSHFRGGGIVYLNDPGSYAGWSFILLVWPLKPDMLQD